MFIYEDSLSQPAQQQFPSYVTEEVSLGSSFTTTRHATSLSSSGGSNADVAIGNASPHKIMPTLRPALDPYGRLPGLGEFEQATRAGFDSLSKESSVTLANGFATPPFQHRFQAANCPVESSQGSFGEELTTESESLASKARSGVVRARSMPNVVLGTSRPGPATIVTVSEMQPLNTARTGTAQPRSSSNVTAHGNGYGGPGFASTSTSTSSHGRARKVEKGGTCIARMRSSSNSNVTGSAPHTHRSFEGPAISTARSSARASDRGNGTIFARARSPRDCRADFRRGERTGTVIARALSPRDGRLAGAGKPGLVFAKALSPRECRELAAGGGGGNPSVTRSYSAPGQGLNCSKAHFAPQRLASPRKTREMHHTGGYSIGLPVRRPAWTTVPAQHSRSNSVTRLR
mmetsp:Transcript_118184/g.217619  ORF Transcript_118184/g.217619 Transcript_118184/m.217619 type:complete len:404 (+) Transcript_118184:111-1322(+)